MWQQLLLGASVLLLLLWPDVVTGQSVLGMENVALGKKCSMTSSYSESGFNNGCSDANNGDTSPYYVPDNCIHTAGNDYHPSWTVDLGAEYSIVKINIIARKFDDSDFRLPGVTVSIDNTEVYSFRAPYSLVTTIELPSPTAGLHVTVTRDTVFLNLCEVEVFACASGQYGTSCQNFCGRGCTGNTCLYDGNCTCGQGWEPPRCEKCVDGHDGGNCSNECGHCANKAPCNKINGTCPSGAVVCDGAFIPPLCQTACDDGNYGLDCRAQCGQCSWSGADHGICDKVNGNCSICQLGWYPPLCHQGCSNKTYGQDCKETCGRCRNKAACDKHSGTCPVGPPNEPLCQEGYTGPKCDNPTGKSENPDVAGPIAGAMVGAGVIIAVAVCLTRRRRKGENNGTIRNYGTSEGSPILKQANRSPS